LRIATLYRPATSARRAARRLSSSDEFRTADVVSLVSRAPGAVAFGIAGTAIVIASAYFRRRLGGVTGDVLGAIGELTEALVLAVFTLSTG